MLQRKGRKMANEGLGVLPPTSALAAASAQQQMESPTNVSYEQRVKGLERAYRTMERARASYMALGRAIGGGNAPIISLPTGLTDAAGEHIVDEIDLNDLVRRLANSASEAEVLMRTIVSPLQGYKYRQYRQAVSELNRCSAALMDMFQLAEQPETGGAA
jgi:hypothetical protein